MNMTRERRGTQSSLRSLEKCPGGRAVAVRFRPEGKVAGAASREGGPPLRHVWTVLASAATSSECGRGCGDLAFFIAPAMNPADRVLLPAHFVHNLCQRGAVLALKH